MSRAVSGMTCSHIGQKVTAVYCCIGMCHVRIILRRSLLSKSGCSSGTFLTLFDACSICARVRPAPYCFAGCEACGLQSRPLQHCSMVRLEKHRILATLPNQSNQAGHMSQAITKLFQQSSCPSQVSLMPAWCHGNVLHSALERRHVRVACICNPGLSWCPPNLLGNTHEASILASVPACAA